MTLLNGSGGNCGHRKCLVELSQWEHRCPDCHSSACVPQLMHCFRPRGGLHWVPPMACSASLSLAETASVLWADFAEPQVHAFELLIHFSLLSEQSNQPCGVLPSFDPAGAHNAWLAGNIVYLARILKPGSSNATSKAPLFFSWSFVPQDRWGTGCLQ